MPESSEAFVGAHMEEPGSRRTLGHISQIKLGDQWDDRGQSSLILSDSSTSSVPAILNLFILSVLYFCSDIFITEKLLAYDIAPPKAVNMNQHSPCQDGTYI